MGCHWAFEHIKDLIHAKERGVYAIVTTCMPLDKISNNEIFVLCSVKVVVKEIVESVSNSEAKFCMKKKMHTAYSVVFKGMSNSLSQICALLFAFRIELNPI